MVDLVARSKELAADYLRQGRDQLVAAAKIVRDWDAGAISGGEAEERIAQLGYNTALEEWPFYFAGLLMAIADEWTDLSPVEGRVIALALALDAGELPEIAAVLRPACPASNFMQAYKVTLTREEAANRLLDSLPPRPIWPDDDPAW
jgi:hypothetical protein